MTQSCRSRLARYRYAVRHSSDGDNTIWSRYKATQSTITPNSQIAELASWRQPRFLHWRRTRHTLRCRCIKPLGTAMNKKAVESTDRKGRWISWGCMTFIVIYGSCLIVMYFATTRKQTEDFTGRTAHEFTVAGIMTSNLVEEGSYRVFNLEHLNSGKIDLTDITFLLPQKSITIYVGDIHSAEILEDNGEWQLVAFYYSNTRTSTSIYRAYQDRIEPVSYRLTSSVGHMFGAMTLLVPALVLSLIVTAILNWRANRVTRMKDA